jgi:hypothetical protein
VRNDRSRNFLSHLGIGVVVLLSSASFAAAQEARSAGVSPSAAPPPEMRVLGDTVRELQAEVQALASQLQEVRADEARDRAQIRELRGESERPQASIATVADASNRQDSYTPYSPGQTSGPPAALPGGAGTPQGTAEQRLTRLEENQQLLGAEITDQNQTKVESGSKYRLRLSGIALMNVFDNQGVVDNQDIPEIALEPNPNYSSGTFGGSLRQSQVKLEAFGPDVAGAHTSASLTFDFAGGFPEVPNGISTGIARLRTGTVRFDWNNTSIIAGQDQLFFSPLAPTSLDSLAVPALSYSGDLWSWTPQIRVEHRIDFSRGSSFLLQGGILDSLSGQAPPSAYQRYPTYGEQSGQPAYAARVSWSVPLSGENLVIGAGGYYGRQSWGFGHNVDGWAGTSDLTLPLGKFFEVTAAFYRGRAVGGLAGGVGQDVLVSGSVINSTTIVKGLDSMGGWAQLKFKPTAKFEMNGAYGQDDPFAGELRMFPASPSYYGPLFSRNASPFVNFIYQVRSDILFSIEYRRLHSTVLDGDSYSANHVGLSVGYIF